MAKTGFKQTHYQKLAIDLQRLECEAVKLGMYETGRAINAAMNKAGWEAARLLTNTPTGEHP